MNFLKSWNFSLIGSTADKGYDDLEAAANSASNWDKRVENKLDILVAILRSSRIEVIVYTYVNCKQTNNTTREEDPV